MSADTSNYLKQDEIISAFIILFVYICVLYIYINILIKDPGTRNPQGVIFTILTVSIVIAVGIFRLLFPLGHIVRNFLLNETFWIITHFIYYFCFAYFVRHKWMFMITKQTLWEVIEYILRRYVYFKYFNESIKKTIADVAINISGYYIGGKIWDYLAM